MNRPQHLKEKPAHEERLKELEEENKLLLLQLHQVQDELEHYFIKSQEFKVDWVDNELPTAVAEAERLRTVVAVQSRVYQLQVENALNVGLVKDLTRSAKSLVRMLMIPGKLFKTWFNTRDRQSSTSVDDQVYQKAVAAYRQCGFNVAGLRRTFFLLIISTYIKGGFQPARKILAAFAIVPSLQVKAYSVLIDYLIIVGDMNAAKFTAWYAYALNPNASSLKRLAFQLARAGAISEADAALDVLPKDIVLSDSERKEVDRISQKVKEDHLRKAKEKTNFPNRRAEMMQQTAALAEALDEQAKLASERQSRIDEIAKDRDEQAKLASERQSRIDEIAKDRDEQAKLASERQFRIDEQARLASESQAKIKQLESELPDFQARQALFAEEMAKAEGQIEIIKEVLLHESEQ